MSARKKKPRLINLLPQEEFAASTTGRVLTWVLSSFRIIVIITEIIVMAAFISRFYFDTRISDLNDEIRQRENLIASYKEFEDGYKLTQKKLAIFKEFSSENKLATPIIVNAVSRLPAQITLTGITLSQQTIDIKGVSPTENQIAQYIANLSAITTFKNISISQIESRLDSPGLSFNITANLVRI